MKLALGYRLMRKYCTPSNPNGFVFLQVPVILFVELTKLG
jgi:hypothetical protein